MDATEAVPPAPAPGRRRRTLLVVGVALACGFIAFMSVIVWALQGLDTAEARESWPLVVLAVAVVTPLVVGYVLRRWRGVSWGALGLVGGVFLTFVGVSVVGIVVASLRG